MTRLVVMYPKPADPEHFDRHFREKHMPLVKKMPGLQAFSYGPAKGRTEAMARSFGSSTAPLEVQTPSARR